jgi:hypothetical protein
VTSHVPDADDDGELLAGNGSQFVATARLPTQRSIFMPYNWLPASHREAASLSGWYTAAVPRPPMTGTPPYTDLMPPEPHRIHPTRAAQLPAVEFRLGADY